VKITVQAAPQVLDAGVSAAQLGSLGGCNADPLSLPVALNLSATDIASNSAIPLPDGVLMQTHLVHLPVLAQPTDPSETFTWLVEVQQDGQFLGYMRYPSTFDPATNSADV
jgi:hypothetical protein